MESRTIHDGMQSVFRSVLNEPDLELTDDLSAAEVPGWDSLAHLGLMLNLEAEFDVTFSDVELFQLDNVGRLHRVIEAKLSV